MRIDFDNVQPWQVEAARSELDRAYKAWATCQFEQIDAKSPAVASTLVHQAAALCEQRRGELMAWENERRRSERRVERLRQSLHVWETWRSPNTPFVLGTFGFIASMLTGLLIGVIDNVALGVFLSFVFLCLMSLAIVIWYASKDDWTVQWISILTVQLRQAEQESQKAMTCAANALATYNTSRAAWDQAYNSYQRIANLYEVGCTYGRTRERYDRLQAIVQSARYRLLHTDWHSMEGTEFERFLERVFEMLGYKVHTTKGSGDQGIDLIMERAGRRIGVQAKRYSKTVGNHAVMEANAGMSYYHCDRCVVITNSRFSRHAIKLASRLNCRLIDGSQLPALIAGQLQL